MARPINEGDLDVIEKNLESRRKQLDDDARAIARVRRMLDEARNGAVQAHLPLGQSVRPIRGFNDAVRSAARGTNGAEFTVPGIEHMLRQQGVKLPGKKSRPRISTVLKEMVDKKILVVVRPGTGKQPHVYKVA
ncbi:MAG: hypothetical protein WD886_08815 [Burkholderiales bacterium]